MTSELQTDLSELFPVETARPGDFAALLGKIIADAPGAYVDLAIHPGERLPGKLALLLSYASADARRVFCGALKETVLARVSAFTNSPDDASAALQLIGLLDIVELSIANGVLRDFVGYTTSLEQAAGPRHPRVRESVARILSYFGSPEAIAAIDRIRAQEGRTQILTAYLLSARSRLEPLYAFDFDFAPHWTEGTDVTLEAPFELAVQRALWRMFERDGLLAQTKLLQLHLNWPAAITALVLEVLRDPPLESNFFARAASSAMSGGDAGVPLSPATGIAARVLKKGKIGVLPGFSMSSAPGPGQSQEYRAEWMTAFLSHLSKIVEVRFNLRPEASWLRWPTNETWRATFDRLLLNSENRFTLDGSVDVCFEMLYLNDMRSQAHQIVEFGRLSTFSVLYDTRNRLIADYFNTLPLDGDRSLRAALNAWKQTGQRSPTPRIFTPIYTAANDMIQLETDLGNWPARERQEYSTVDDLFARLTQNPDHTVAVCDNVSANDILGRPPDALRLEVDRLLYPSPIAIGLGYDMRDMEWGAILDDAFHNVVADADESVRASLLSFIAHLSEIDGVPTGALKTMFAREESNERA